MTTPTEFESLEDLFHELAELPADERSLRLAELERSDPGAHARVARLLAFDDPTSEQQLVDALGVVPELGPGDRVGPYLLGERLGAGGMGVVFAAEQSEPFQREVALKLVRAGFDSRRVLARFEAERGTLARMTHPGIAQVHDAGTAPDGRPYLVMEKVDGEPITQFCDRHRSSIRERIELFRQVCQAVQHAHRKGVLHRDLKPANLLVADESGVATVKVIDFGIAKLIATEPGSEGLTRRGEVVGTPEYMSPEQTRGDDVDTRSDVYSLGVVLYELVTGGTPIASESLRSASPVEIARVVETAVTPAPAERLRGSSDEVRALASARGTEASRLRRELRSDLGQILLMALRKEPDRRYGSVEQFSLDLDHWLKGRPVVARPDSFAYRVSKVVARHTAAVVAGAVLLVGLLGASAFSTVMYLRADAARLESEAQRAATERINEFLKSMLSSIDPERARGRDVSLLREVLDEAASRIDGELGELPVVAADLAMTVGSVYRSIGDEDLAVAQLRTARATLLEAGTPDAALLATVEQLLGTLLQDRDEYEEGEDLLRSALARRLAADPHVPVDVANARRALADLLEDVGGYEEAAELYEGALAQARLAADPPAEDLAALLRGYGEYLMNHHRMDEAGALLEEALRVRREAGQAGIPLVGTLQTYGRWLRWSGSVDEAFAVTGEAEEIVRRELAPDHPMRLNVLAAMANLHQHRDEPEAAEALYREALEAQLAVHGPLHTSVATTSNNLASLLREVGRLEEAESLFADATRGYVESFGPDHYWTSISRANRAATLFRLGRFAEAEDELVEARRVRVKEGALDWQMAEVDVLLAACRVRRGRPDGQEAVLRSAIAVLRERYGDDTPRIEPGLAALAELER